MKILVVTNDFPPRVGGINYYVDQIMRRFPQGEVIVFAADWPGAAAFDRTWPHPVIRWTSDNMGPTKDVRARIVDVIRTEQPDLFLFGATFPLGKMAPAIARATGVPYAGFTHGVEVAISRAPLARRIFGRIGREAAMLTTVSEWCRGILRPVVGSKTPIELLPPGIDAELFHPAVTSDHIRARHGLGDGPVIAHVSRLVKRKGQDKVIRALPAILREFPGARFVIVGKGPDERRLRALVAKNNVEHAVVFTGEVPYEELPAYFHVGDVFAMPCRNRWLGYEVEAYGAVYLQANAVGRPCVGGDAGGAPEAVRHDETGLVCDGTSVADVTESLLALLRDPARAAAMGANGAAWVHRDLTWDAIASRLRSMLSDTLANV